MNRTRIAPNLARGVRLSVVIALLGALFSVTVPPPKARAANIVVTTAADELDGWLGNGACSLREAINNANLNNSGQVDCAAGTASLDTITFDAAIDGVPIVLTGAPGENSNATGDLDVLDGGDLTVQGNGAANTIIDGGGNDRVFDICHSPCARTITLNGVTVRNGEVSDGGGGVANGAQALNIQNSTIGGPGGGNEADSGGGIYNSFGSTLTLNGTIVSDNTAANNGGGICNVMATLVVQNNSTIGEAGVGNHATNGGGIYQNTGTVTVSASTVISNTATDDGGGIFNQAGVTTVDASTISGNTAESSYSAGGGIYNEDTLVVQNGSLIGGAGAGNHANYGAGINNDHGGTATVSGSTVSGNSSDSLYSVGGGICNWATLTVTDSLIGGAGAGNHAANGGGIGNWTGTATVDGSVVSGNTSPLGGGIFNFATLVVRNGSVIGGEGAGEGNEALTSPGRGGGINNSRTATLTDSRIVGNVAKQGGGIISGGNLNVQNVTIIGNTATDIGGGICNGDRATVEDSTLDTNSALYGGGVYNIGAVTVTNSTIGGAGTGNHATVRGGAIYSEGDGSTTVTGCNIRDNTATINGGGVFTDEDVPGATSVTGSCIVGNSDTSFFNNHNAAQQIATGNWWGAPTGPNTPGADTAGGNVNTSGYLTTPPAFCFCYTYLPLVLKDSP